MIYYRIWRFIALVIFKLAFGLKVEGRQNIPKKGGFILAANHVSYLDPLALGIACNRPVNFMARSNLFKDKLLSAWLNAVGAIPVKRDAADLLALKQAVKCIKAGGGVALFPEGRRTRETTAPFKPGAGVGFLAEKLNVPVIPAFIKGTDKALPKGSRSICFKKISVRLGKQIYAERGKPYQEIADVVMDHIRNLEH